MNIDDLKKTINDYYNNTNDNIIGVGYGKKCVNGSLTDDNSIMFTVLEKKPISELQSDEIIPSIIDVNGENIKTDVIVGTIPEPLYSTCPWNGTTPSNQNLIRPLKGGIQIQTQIAENVISTATMACVVVDNDTNSLAILTAAHTCVKDVLQPSNYTGWPNQYQNYIKYKTYQPVFGTNNEIGFQKKYIPLKGLPESNTTDCALITINNKNLLHYTGSTLQYGLTGETFYPFATTSEIDGLFDSDARLYCSGRSSGARGQYEPYLHILNLYQSQVIGPYKLWTNDGQLARPQESLPYIDFNDLFTLYAGADFANRCTPSSQLGDSGSAIIGVINGIDKIIGILIASDGDLTWGCRIDNVASALNISPYSGNLTNFQSLGISDIDNASIHYETGVNNNPFITLENKKYWNQGARVVTSQTASVHALNQSAAIFIGYITIDSNIVNGIYNVMQGGEQFANTTECGGYKRVIVYVYENTFPAPTYGEQIVLIDSLNGVYSQTFIQNNDAYVFDNVYVGVSGTINIQLYDISC